MKNIAIIAAAGSGKRMGAEMPKQYLMLSGKPILAHTLSKFEDASSIDAVILVLPQNDMDYVKKEIVGKEGMSKVTAMIAGGKERQDSVLNAIDMIGNETDVVVIHDGARPFVKTELINLSVEGALKYGAVAAGVPVKDTVKSVNDRGIIKNTLDRDSIWVAQTPQAFRREIICEAYRSAYENNYAATDDSCLVERIGIEARMITGSSDNIKITTKDDIIFGEALLRR